MNKKDKILTAYAIAARDLRSCYNPSGIVAGRTHFNSYWSRDGFWAVFGALELRDFEQAKSHLELFIKYQKKSGQMPVRIDFLSHTFGNYQGLKSRLAPVFRAARLVRPVDPAALFVIAMWQYYRHTNDKKFLDESFSSIEKSVDWLKSLDKDGDSVLETGFLSDWMDSILKSGKVFNVNIIYYKSLDNFRKICVALEKHDLASHYSDLVLTAKKQITDIFWNGQYFVDWRRNKNYGGFSSDGNILAILYKLASPEQARVILNFIRKNHLENNNGLKTAYPAYSWHQIMPAYYIYGIPDYHSKLYWPWLSSLHVLAKWRSGDKHGALETLHNQALLFTKRGFVAEVYGRQGSPVERLIYQSEIPFAWNAAAYIYAVKSVGLAGKHMVLKS